MRFVLYIDCEGPAFSGSPPNDLLTETARLLREAAALVESGGFYIPTTGAYRPRMLHDAAGSPAGEAGFTITPTSHRPSPRLSAAAGPFNEMASSRHSFPP
jgi:hypothetical protein